MLKSYKKTHVIQILIEYKIWLHTPQCMIAGIWVNFYLRFFEQYLVTQLTWNIRYFYF